MEQHYFQKKHRQLCFFIAFITLLLLNSLSLQAQTFTDNTYPGTSESWSVPAGVTSVTVQVWGGGGSGGGSNTNRDGGSGGGGGGYSTRTFAVIGGQVITYTIGTGGASTIAANGNNGQTTTVNHIPSTTTLVANGGGFGTLNANPVGAGGTASGGSTNTTGSNGGNGGGNSGGAGGNAAGAGGGVGGVAGSNGNGGAGAIPGGGGGGGEEGNGGSGGNGQIIITYTVPALTNNDCSGAIALTLNTSCSYVTYSNATATASTGVPAPGCASYSGADVWFSFVVPASGQVTVDTQTGIITDSGMAWYTGTCGSLTLLECDDDDSTNGLMSSITRTGLTPGTTIYVRFWEYGNDNNGTFGICATSPGPCTAPIGQATGFTPGTITSTTFPATFSGTADSYLVIQSTSATPPSLPVNGIIYNAANIATLGAGLTFVQAGASTTISGTGLTGNTHYYYYIYAYNNNGCSGGPLYNAAAGLTGNATTCPAPPASVSTSSGLTSFSLSWLSSLGGGSNAVSYQIQVTTDSGYTANILGSPFTVSDPTTTLNVTGLTANTTYYYRIRATNGCFSNYVNGIATTGYCLANNTTNTTYYISGVTTTGGVANFANTPTLFTAGGYANYYTTNFVSQNAGLSFNISATHPSSTYGYSVWVDWNNDLDFNDAGENVLTTSYLASPVALGSVTLPPGTPIGDYRMRIRNAYLSTPAPSCGDFAYGEAEDYKITCLGPLPCAGNPSAVTVNVTSQTTATVTWTAAVPVPANGYQYYLSTTNTSPVAATIPTGATGAGIVTINLTGLTSATTYYIWVRSNCGGGLGQGAWVGPTTFYQPNCTIGSSTGTTTLGCPSVIAGGLTLGNIDPPAITCASASCVDLEATFLALGDTSTYTVSSIPYAPPYQFGCLKNAVSVNIDDRWSPLVNLPFNFCYYGNSYNSCVIGSNGILTFDTTKANTGSGYAFSNSLPSTTGALFANTIYGVYHDIDPSKGGEVGYELITLNTGCRALVASWNNVPMFSNNTLLYTGMMVLYENTNVIEVYIKEKNIDGTWNGGNAIVGVQNAAGTAAVVAPGRNGLDTDWTSTNQAWRFVPAGASITTIKWHEGSGITGPVIGNTNVLNVCPTSTTIYTAEVNYSLCNGTTLVETEETTVTVSTDKVWNGSSSADWNIANNWTPSGVPTALQSVSIPNVANDPIIGGGVAALACSLTVQNGAVLTVNASNSITVTNVVTVVAGGTFNIRNTGSLVQVNNVTNIGNINMERISNLRLQDYCYWSSPVGNLLAGTFPVQSVSPLTPAGYIFKWGPTTVNPNGGQGYWVTTTENMIPTRGYILRAPNGFNNVTTSPLTANFIGVPNNGIYTPTISRGTDFTTVGTQGIPRTATDDNWNLIGNPYPSAIGVKEFINLAANSNIVGGVRIWTHAQLPTNATDPFYQNFTTNYYPADYTTINLVGATSGPGDYKIGSGQGFMVLMTAGAAGSATVTFNNAMRSAAFANNQFYRSGNSNKATSINDDSRIWLDLVGSTGNVSRTLVGYVNGATQDEDRLYDSFTDNKPTQNFYSLINNEPMLIQGRTLPFDISDQVPLGVKVPTNGTYNIAIATVDGLFTDGAQIVYLEDKLLNVIHNLTASQYQFTANQGTVNDRFVLRYTENALSNNDFNYANDVKVFANNGINITSTTESIKEIIVYDVLGKTLLDMKNISKHEVILNELRPTKNVLIVKVILANDTVVIKKVVY
ncbi:GEVED domain-containing protein [Flavobacterium sp.]|uniref:GEVED domain-containing protein n=1 Tax=Flavobacterium sp. TaxID=239 RepID=UPI00374D3E03